MVKGIFCHDLPVYRDCNGDYCSTTLTDDLFRRYFDAVDELTVATRVYKLDCTYAEAHQEKITLPNIRFLEFPNLNKPQYVFTLIPQAQKTMDEEIAKTDLIFIRGGTIAAMAVKSARKLHKPYLREAAGCAWDEYWNHSLTGKLIAPYKELSARRGIRNADYVIYVTEKWLQNRYPTKGQSTYASNVILKEIDPEAVEKRKHRMEKFDVGGTWVLGTTAGVNTRAKGQQFVIEAMARLKDEIDIRYELVGTGDNSYLKSVAQKFGVEDRVVFKGELSHAEVLNWLETIDLYIQPSMQEGLPRALIEAMSKACPAIGSTTAGIPELLEPEMIFRRGNVRELVERLRQMKNEDWLSHGIRNYEKSREYQIDLLNARRRKLYQRYRDDVMNGRQEPGNGTTNK